MKGKSAVYFNAVSKGNNPVTQHVFQIAELQS